MRTTGPSTPTATVPPGAPRTETSHAIMTTGSRTLSVVPPEILDLRIGRATVAGALNDQIRIRFDGSGRPSERRLVPDNDLTGRLMASPAGPRLERQIRGALGHLDAERAAMNLKGITLNPDASGTAITELLTQLEANPILRTRLARFATKQPQLARAYNYMTHEAESETMPNVVAWHDLGWIAMMPKPSRAMLTLAGAYRPRRGEGLGSYSTYLGAGELSATLAHELEHAVTESPERDYDRREWIEEGLADLLSEPTVFQRQVAKSTGISAKSYASALSRAPTFDVGWRRWKQPEFTEEELPKENEKVQRNYGDSQVILTDLLHLAGVSLRSNAGRSRARDILQGQSQRFVPGRLADAIIEHRHLDPSVREHLRRRITTAIDTPNAVERIREDFGIRR